MGNSRKPSAPIKGQVREMKPLTAEEREQQAARMYLQKRESITTGILFNALHNPEILKAELTPEDLADFAIELADKVIEKLYFNPSEKEEVKTPKPGSLEETCASETCAYKGHGVCSYKEGDFCPHYKKEEK